MNRGDVDEEARISESRAMPMQARRRLFAEWFQSAYLSVPETARL